MIAPGFVLNQHIKNPADCLKGCGHSPDRSSTKPSADDRTQSLAPAFNESAYATSHWA
jgi:hypothetical protein